MIPKKRGRPCKDNKKSNQYRLRMTDEELAMLDFVSGKTGESKADVFRRLLKMAYNLAKNQG